MRWFGFSDDAPRRAVLAGRFAESMSLQPRRLSDARRIQLFAVSVGHFRYVGISFDLVTGGAEQLDIAFSVLSAVDKSADMVVFGAQFAAFKGYYQAAMKVLANYEAAPVASIFAEPEADYASESDVSIDAAPVSEESEADRVKAAVMSVQKRLKKMHYSPGIIDGCWGSGISGALSSFLNDRPLTMAAPTSLEMFMEALASIKVELCKAEGEKPPFVRPVSEDRKSADPKTVAAVAPEVVPTRRGFLAAVWAAITTFVSAIVTSISDYIAKAWNFFTDHKDIAGKRRRSGHR